ncbi:hypothetical protein RUM43_004863 [Polyplax serrata]|uniref:Ankyrin repeat and fibronectin type-III domain-containing protein 1 n=1 Tax=Polyplax serrata TaxID=468196 RepID=A0AAN8XLT0_POLSC
MDFWVDGFKISNKKKVDKINKINIHLHALFSAVENGHVDKARTILESSDLDVNCVNGDGFTPLDVAVLTNHKSLAKMLLAFGAQEGNHFQTPEKLENHLKNLSIEADRRVQELNGGGLGSPDHTITTNLNNNRASFSVVGHYPSSSAISCHGGSGESEKELLIWKRRSNGLKKMLVGFDQTRPPDMPFLVAVDVTGTNSVNVRYQSPEQQDASICTKYKVQWSENESFDILAGEKEITDVKCLECAIGDLIKGKRYWFRVACGNLKGYGKYKVSSPTSVVPSSWRDGQSREPRFSGTLQQLEEIFEGVKNLRPETASEIKDFFDQEKQGESLAVPRRTQKKKTIKQLFTVAGKFQKHLKRGVYLVCLFYHEDKILVTNEDFLPAIEVDETYPSSINNDLHWFMKVACTWSDVKCLKQDMEKNLTSTTTSHFRIKLLQAAQQMQSNLCTQDLGQLYYKPIRDAQGTLVFCSVNSLTNLKSISVLNLRWTPISKIQKKIVASEESNVGELLMASIQSQIAYHRMTNLKLSKGLYLGYLKMKSSVDLIQIIVPTKTPNVLPHCKIRNNPHVSSDEWDWLRRINSRHKSLENLQSQVKDIREADFLKGTEQQQMFVEQVAGTARKLFSYLDVSMDDAMLHRLYDFEVVDLNSDVSFLIIVPPVETSCSVPGQKDSLLDRGDLMSISLQVFEMIHLGTYQPDVISRYSRLSCILELDLILAQHSHREAFSSSEVQAAKDRLSRLQELQIQLNGVWKNVRWIMDLITFARDRSASAGSLQYSQKSTGNLQSNSTKTVGLQTSSLSTGISNCGMQTVTGVPMKHLLALTKKKEGSKKSPNRLVKSKCLKENHHQVKCEKRTLLQIPDSPKDPKILKSNVSRGSWPGPGVDSAGAFLDSSLSKSEQHLNVLGGGGGGEIHDGSYRKFSDCSSEYLTREENELSMVGETHNYDRTGRRNSGREAMSSIGNRMLFSKSEDYLFLNQDLGSFKEPNERISNRNRTNGTTGLTTTSVSATNSPLLPQRNLCNNALNRMNAGSSLSVTNTSGSLHSVSSDESTAAVVSLPVTTPFRSAMSSNTSTSAPVQHSASLMSLAKPIIPPNGGKGPSKNKIPVTLSLNSLTDMTNLKRPNNTSGLVTSGSILSGNCIPVNINQKPLKTGANLPDTAILNQHISSSLPSFSKHSASSLPGLLPGVTPGNQRIQSPVKSPIKAVSPIDTVLSGASGMKRTSPAAYLTTSLPPDMDLLQHTGLTLDHSRSHSMSVGHKLLQTGTIKDGSSEGAISGFSSSGRDVFPEENNDVGAEDLEKGVKVPTLSSGVLQVYAAYETGLAAGTSLKLHVTPRTSAREVVDLVVKQLNMAVLLKGKDGPIYSAEKLKNFCLVAVIGARERCLRDDFKPLQLQNPWKKGRLYVRQKQDVLAAIEYSSRQTAFL